MSTAGGIQERGNSTINQPQADFWQIIQKTNQDCRANLLCWRKAMFSSLKVCYTTFGETNKLLGEKSCQTRTELLGCHCTSPPKIPHQQWCLEVETSWSEAHEVPGTFRIWWKFNVNIPIKKIFSEKYVDVLNTCFPRHKRNTLIFLSFHIWYFILVYFHLII